MFFSSFSVQITYDKDEVGDLSDPKFGKIDPSNDPHVGGNTWAGGTGKITSIILLSFNRL